MIIISRNENSDVEVFRNAGEKTLDCCSCLLTGISRKRRYTVSFRSVEGAARHMSDHAAAGHRVPDFAWEQVLGERKHVSG